MTRLVATVSLSALYLATSLTVLLLITLTSRLQGIVVKVITKDLGAKFYKQKGYIVEVLDKYRALIRLLDGGQKLKLDQQHLETVVPAAGR